MPLAAATGNNGSPPDSGGAGAGATGVVTGKPSAVVTGKPFAVVTGQWLLFPHHSAPLNARSSSDFFNSSSAASFRW